ncbi:hypothetical protein D9M68_684720 [compost metagenome]
MQPRGSGPAGHAPHVQFDQFVAGLAGERERARLVAARHLQVQVLAGLERGALAVPGLQPDAEDSRRQRARGHHLGAVVGQRQAFGIGVFLDISLDHQV